MRLTEEQSHICIKRNGEKCKEHSVLLNEHAMDIYTDGQVYASVVCTQEHLEELVLGRLLSDGMIRTLDEIKLIKIPVDGSLVDVEMVDDKTDDCCDLEFKSVQMEYPDEWIFAMAEVMAEGMPLHEQTWATHSCFLFAQGKLLFSCEDISRHNAVDKVIGYALKNKLDFSKCAIYSSGRVPVDMVDKVWNAGIPVLVSKGMPTNQAVRFAKECGLTLICGARRDQMRVYSDFRKLPEESKGEINE